MKQVWKCEVCNEVYDEVDGAIKCEEWHKECHCKRNSQHLIGAIDANDYSLRVIMNFEDKKIETAINKDGERFISQVASMTHCPFCGREL